MTPRKRYMEAGAGSADLCRKYGMSDASFHK